MDKPQILNCRGAGELSDIYIEKLIKKTLTRHTVGFILPLYEIFPREL